MRFRRIHFDGEKAVDLKWSTFEQGDETKHERTTHEAPAPSFLKAMQAFAAWIREVCELPREWEVEFSVRGVAIDYYDDLPGIVVSATRKLAATNGPLNLSTPHVRIIDVDGDEVPGFIRTADKLLEGLEAEAKRYLAKHREQTDAFEGAEDSDQTELEEEIQEEEFMNRLVTFIRDPAKSGALALSMGHKEPGPGSWEGAWTDQHILDAIRDEWREGSYFDDPECAWRGGDDPAFWWGQTDYNGEPTLSGLLLVEAVRGVFEISRPEVDGDGTESLSEDPGGEGLADQEEGAEEEETGEAEEAPAGAGA